MAVYSIPFLVALKYLQPDPQSIACQKDRLTKVHMITLEIRVFQNAVVLIDLGIYYAIERLNAMSRDHILVAMNVTMRGKILGIEVVSTRDGEEKRIYQVGLDWTTAMALRMLEIRDQHHAIDRRDLRGTGNIPTNIIVLGLLTPKLNPLEM